jgi:hypothetical protein
MSDDSEPRISNLIEAARPEVREFLSSLRSASDRYPQLALSETIEATLGVVVAALGTRGICLAIFPFPHADFRVEVFRAAIRQGARTSTRVVLCTRSLSLVDEARAYEAQAVAKTAIASCRTLDDVPSATNVGPFLLVVDLDTLPREARLAQVRDAAAGTASAVLVGSKTDSPIVHAAASSPDIPIFGFNQDQLRVLDKPPATEAELTKDWTWVPPERRRLPTSLAEVDERVWLKNTWLGSTVWRSAAYRGIAVAIARREIMRASSVIKTSIVASDDGFAREVEEAAAAIAALRRGVNSVGYAASKAQRDALDACLTLFYRLRSVCVPTGKYDAAAARKVGIQTFEEAFQSLVVTTPLMRALPDEGAAYTAAIAALAKAEEMIRKRNAKTEEIAKLVANAIAHGRPATVLVSDEAEQDALWAHFDSFVKFEHDGVPTRATRRRLTEHNVRLWPMRRIRDLEATGLLILPKLPPYYYAREAFLRGASEVATIIYANETQRYQLVLGRDRAVEARLFTPKRQDAALVRVAGPSARVPTAVRKEPQADPAALAAEAAAKRAVEPNGDATALLVFETSEFFGGEDPFWVACRRQAEDEADDDDADVLRSLPGDTVLHGVRVWFADSSYMDCDERMAIDALRDEEDKTRPKTAGALSKGDCILVSDQDATRSTIVAIAGRLQATSPRAVEALELNKVWRDAIEEHRVKSRLKWRALFEECKKNGYANKTPWSIYAYTAPIVWLPESVKSFEALLLTVSPRDLYLRRKEIYDASARLRKLSGALKRRLREQHLARRNASGIAKPTELERLVLDKDWNVTFNDFEDLFDVKEVDHVEPNVSYRLCDRGRIKRAPRR